MSAVRHIETFETRLKGSLPHLIESNRNETKTVILFKLNDTARINWNSSESNGTESNRPDANWSGRILVCMRQRSFFNSGCNGYMFLTIGLATFNITCFILSLFIESVTTVQIILKANV